MDPDLETLLEEFNRVRSDAEALTAPLSTEQLLWKPETNKWSIIECFAHLNVVDGMDVPALRSTIKQAHKDGITKRGPFRYGLVSGWFVRSMEPPVRRFKFTAPGAYFPSAVREPRETIGEFLRIQTEIGDLVRAADGINLARVKVRLPIGPGLKMSLGRRLQLLAAHDRRHLWQARQVLSLNPST